ncbi:MAG: Unknown protein [uncultured Thiotrichaceae bacterium]|uniref:Uncharacterized protein n=1 Tax=uncultured Thiotrichaceae bacterium TaxID=298394 RepID=A0A6S6SC18_9GAMM|nr:MAG: Unknown protein [uncultured Thiotrichaceae bacterium]
MAEKKINFDHTCFGTIDTSNEDKNCNNCSYSDECNTFKSKPGGYFKIAAAKGKSNYLKELRTQRRITLGKLIGYSITIAMLAFVGLQLAKTF